jgi:hypothetical protein
MSPSLPEDPGELVASKGPNGVELSFDGALIATAPTVEALIGELSQREDGGGLSIGPGMRLTLAGLALEERATLLHSALPAASVWDTDGVEAWEQEKDSELAWEVPILECGITVEGEPWGWFELRDDDARSVRHALVPTGPREMMIKVDAMFSGRGMGASYEDGIIRFGTSTAVFYRWSEEGMSLRCDYEIADWEQFCEPILRDFFVDIMICPACLSDWDANVQITDELSRQWLGRQLAWIWRPCSEHQGARTGTSLHAIAGADWQWDGSRWMLR